MAALGTARRRRCVPGHLHAIFERKKRQRRVLSGSCLPVIRPGGVLSGRVTAPEDVPEGRRRTRLFKDGKNGGSKNTHF